MPIYNESAGLSVCWAQRWIWLLGITDVGKSSLASRLVQAYPDMFLQAMDIDSLKIALARTAESKVNNSADCLRRSFLDYVVTYFSYFSSYICSGGSIVNPTRWIGTSVWMLDNHFHFPIGHRHFVRVSDASSFRHLNIEMLVVLQARPEVLFARHAKLDKPHHKLAMSVDDIDALQKLELQSVSSTISKGNFKAIWAANNNIEDTEISLQHHQES